MARRASPLTPAWPLLPTGPVLRSHPPWPLTPYSSGPQTSAQNMSFSSWGRDSRTSKGNRRAGLRGQQSVKGTDNRQGREGGVVRNNSRRGDGDDPSTEWSPRERLCADLGTGRCRERGPKDAGVHGPATTARAQPRRPALAKVHAPAARGNKGCHSNLRRGAPVIRHGAAGSKPGIHPGRLELPVGGVQAPAVHSCLPSLLPSPIKSELCAKPLPPSSQQLLP